MRPGQSNKRSRGRGGRKGPSPLSRSYESNGPDVKIRGTAQHIADKYINLARDAQTTGDPVLSEAYFQHAEHFYRIVAAAQQQMNQPVNVKRADDPIETEDSNEENESFDPSDPDSPQPQMNGNGSGNGRDGEQRRSFDDDGERRPRRNRGRSRRGRDDDRSDPRSGNGDARAEGGREASSDTRAPQAGEDTPSNAETTAPDAAPAEMPKVEATSSEAPKTEAKASDTAEGEAVKPARARRTPRPRKASVDVSDRADGGETPAAPKPVSLGDDVPPVQATSDDS